VDDVLALLAQLDLGIVRQAVVEGLEPLAHGGLHLLDEHLGVLRRLEHVVVGVALLVEVGGQILFWVAVAVGAFYPDLLGTQALA